MKFHKKICRPAKKFSNPLDKTLRRFKLRRMKKEGKTKEQVYAEYRKQWHEKFKDLEPEIKEAKRMRLNRDYPDLKL